MPWSHKEATSYQARVDRAAKALDESMGVPPKGPVFANARFRLAMALDLGTVIQYSDVLIVEQATKSHIDSLVFQAESQQEGGRG